MTPSFNEAKERAEQRGDEYRFGKIDVDLAAVPLSVRMKYLPDGIIQRNSVMDTNGCASRSPVFMSKGKLTYFFHNGMHPELKKWLKGPHIIDGEPFSYVVGEGENAKVVVDETFIEILSGTKPDGNSLKAPVHAIHEHGLIPECLPLEDDMTWEEYMDPKRITQDMLDLGKEFNRRLGFYYEQVPFEAFELARNEDFLDVALHAWHFPTNGIYYCNDTKFNHAVPEIDNEIHVGDSYEPHVKKLDTAYPHFDWGYSLSIPKQTPFPDGEPEPEPEPEPVDPPTKSWLAVLIEWILSLFGIRLGATGLSIRNIALHHAGTLGSDPYVSTAHLTVENINKAHKERWNFPSQYMKDWAGKPYYCGYNAIYDPKTRTFAQTRAIGEETAAQRGYNFDTFSLCIIGNFMKRPMGAPKGSVDTLTKQIEDDVTLFLHDLINGNKRKLFVAPGTTVDLAVSRVRPHRFYQLTECYGTGISDTHFRDLLIAYKPSSQVPIPSQPDAFESRELEKRALLLKYLQQLLALYQKMLDSMPRVSGKDDSHRCCEPL